MDSVRLFEDNAYRRTFRARVMRRLVVTGQPAVVLDRTCFYPASGGQPADRGTLDGVAVIDVVEQNGAIAHVLAADLPAARVEGEIDWPRRFDHMQQHSGQHVLSQCFVRVLGAPTISFHLGEAVSTIDVELADLSALAAEQVEDLANAVVFENRPVRAVSVSAGEASGLELRKPPAPKRRQAGMLRVVSIADFDHSPCGGTHVRATGELGSIKIRKWERRTRGVRVEFLVGWRALRDYRWKNGLINDLSGELSVKDSELAVAVERVLGEGRAARREVEHLREKLLDYEALELIAVAALVGPWRVVRQVFHDRDVAALRWLAQRLSSHGGTIALLGLAAAKSHFVFARSADVPLDLSALLERVCQMVGGRGGGRPELAQGGAPEATRASEALELAFAEIERTAAVQGE